MNILKKNIMRQIKFDKILCICAISLIGLCACNDKETYDIEGNEGFVYLNELKGFPRCMDERSIVKTFSGVLGEELRVKFPVKCTMPANKTTKVSFGINNNYVDEYNAQNGTNYISLDENILAIENQSLTIAKGNIESADSLTLCIPKENILSVEEGNYLIPIEIKETDGLPRTELTERNIYHLTLNVKFRNILFATEAEMNGIATLVTDKSDWSIKYVGVNTMPNINKIIDGNNLTYSNVRWNSGDYFELDLGQVHNTLMGLYLNFNFSYYGWRDIHVSVSEDGAKWIGMGDDNVSTSDQIRAVKFLSPIKARYIRFEPITQPQYSYIFMSEVSIYE